MVKDELIKMLAEIEADKDKDKDEVVLSKDEAELIKKQVKALQDENAELKKLTNKGEPAKKGQSDFMKELFK